MEHAIWFGWAGGVLLVARIAPQVTHIVRTGRREGVSRAGVWCWLGNDLGWFAYGLGAGLTPLWVSSAALIALDMTLLWLLDGHRTADRPDLAGIAWATIMLTLTTTTILPYALIVASFVGTVPHAIRSIRDQDLSGISPATWRLAGLDGALWLVYGGATGDGPVTLYAALTLGCAAIILTQLQRKQSTATHETGLDHAGRRKAAGRPPHLDRS